MWTENDKMNYDALEGKVEANEDLIRERLEKARTAAMEFLLELKKSEDEAAAAGYGKLSGVRLSLAIGALGTAASQMQMSHDAAMGYDQRIAGLDEAKHLILMS